MPKPPMSKSPITPPPPNVRKDTRYVLVMAATVLTIPDTESDADAHMQAIQLAPQVVDAAKLNYAIKHISLMPIEFAETEEAPEPPPSVIIT